MQFRWTQRASRAPFRASRRPSGPPRPLALSLAPLQLTLKSRQSTPGPARPSCIRRCSWHLPAPRPSNKPAANAQFILLSDAIKTPLRLFSPTPVFAILRLFSNDPRLPLPLILLWTYRSLPGAPLVLFTHGWPRADRGAFKSRSLLQACPNRRH